MTGVPKVVSTEWLSAAILDQMMASMRGNSLVISKVEMMENEKDSERDKQMEYMLDACSVHL